eukprot:TRINITY_DN9264_c0_g1_i1.p1 TRINITY_DN9264_c0_g1~~TRINITY_DN9264_c0_g1_i1.p1  ORF type:complete len:341 (+),score=36.05 TRINITY_DN9264_c0_g1_i1:80-1102(+)
MPSETRVSLACCLERFRTRPARTSSTIMAVSLAIVLWCAVPVSRKSHVNPPAGPLMEPSKDTHRPQQGTRCWERIGTSPGAFLGGKWELDPSTKCSLVTELWPILANRTVYIMGNSVMRDTAFTLLSLYEGSPMPDLTEQKVLVGKTKRRPDEPPYNYGFERDNRAQGSLRVRFGFAMWFQNNKSQFSPEFFTPDLAAATGRFFGGSTQRDVLLVMIGHNYPFDGQPPPTKRDRQYFLDSVQAAFQGQIVFMLAPPVFDSPQQQRIWKDLDSINSDSLRFFQGAGVAVIDSGHYCNQNTSHLYADRIHLGRGPGRTPGLLSTTTIRLLTSIVSAAEDAHS